MSVPLRTFAVLKDQLDAGADVAPAMRALLDASAEERPHEEWQRLRELAYTSGASFIRGWLDRVMAEDPISAPVDGLWFGLFTAAYEDGEARADVYVHGCKFDPVDPDWACTPLWKPGGTYAHSDLLREVHRIAYGTPEGSESTPSTPRCSASLRCPLPLGHARPPPPAPASVGSGGSWSSALTRET
jgi:hypothetical protein